MENKIKNLLNDLLEYAESAEPLNNVQFAMNQMKSAIQNRIFNDTGGVKDIDGISGKGYSKGHKSTRLKKGRQVQYKDFNLSDRLTNSLQLQVVEEAEGKAHLVIYIKDKRNQDIAGYLTTQTNKKAGTNKIFAASKEELKERDDVIKKLTESDLNTIYEKYG